MCGRRGSFGTRKLFAKAETPSTRSYKHRNGELLPYSYMGLYAKMVKFHETLFDEKFAKKFD